MFLQSWDFEKFEYFAADFKSGPLQTIYALRSIGCLELLFDLYTMESDDEALASAKMTVDLLVPFFVALTTVSAAAAAAATSDWTGGPRGLWV